MAKRYLKAKATTWAMAEGKKAPQVAVLFNITTEGSQEGRLTWYGSFSEEAADRTIESLRYMGWVGDDLERLEGLDANEVELVVEDEEYNGQVRAKVQWVNRLGALSIKAPLAGQALSSFAAQMKARVRALDAAKGLKPAAASTAPVQSEVPFNAEDVPF